MLNLIQVYTFILLYLLSLKHTVDLSCTSTWAGLFEGNPLHHHHHPTCGWTEIMTRDTVSVTQTEKI